VLSLRSSADEEEREQKLSFWRDAFRSYQRAAHPRAAPASTNGGTPTKHAALSFTLAEVQKSMARRGEISTALETVLCQLLSSEEIRPVTAYSQPQQHAASSGVKAAVGKVGGFLWSFVSPSKASTTKLPAGRYVMVEQVERAAEEVIERLEDEAPQDVWTLEELQKMSGRPQADLLLLIYHLQSSPTATNRLYEAFPAPAEDDLCASASATTRVRVFKLASSPDAVSSIDHARAMLRGLIVQLRGKAREKEDYADEREREARRLLQQKRRPLALIQLQMKKRCLTQLHALHSQLDNLDVLLTHLEQSISQAEFLACMRSAQQTLRQVRTSVSVEEVNEVAEELSEQMAQVKIVDETMAQPGQCDTREHRVLGFCCALRLMFFFRRLSLVS
jgi:hypothetical protein